MKKQDKLFQFFHYPEALRHRLRITNLAKDSSLIYQGFHNDFHGLIDKEHITLIVELFIQGVGVFKKNILDFYQNGDTQTILNLISTK